MDAEDYVAQCALCGKTLDWRVDFMFQADASWGGPNTWADGQFEFCSQEHAAQFFAERTLAEPEPIPQWKEPGRAQVILGGAGVATFVIANLAIYVLGMVALIRWIWS